MNGSAHPTAGGLLGTVARLTAAAAIVVGGLIHLQLWFDGYRDVPDANLGRSFLLNAAASIVVAGALVARRDAAVRMAGIGLVVGTLAAFALSRTDRGVFGFTEQGFEPSPQAALTLVAELAALVLLTATFLPAVGAGRAVPLRAAGTATGLTIATAAVLGLLWARSDDRPVAAAAPGSDSVSISDFAFGPASLTTSVGATVTWTNADGFTHTVTARDGAIDSGPLAGGTSYSHTFDAAGTYAYVCAIHPSMTGTVVVSE